MDLKVRHQFLHIRLRAKDVDETAVVLESASHLDNLLGQPPHDGTATKLSHPIYRHQVHVIRTDGYPQRTLLCTAKSLFGVVSRYEIFREKRQRW